MSTNANRLPVADPSASIIERGVSRVSNRISDLRARGSVSVAELAGQVGVSRLTLRAVEAGLYVPSLPLAIRLARALNHSVEDIFAG